MQLQYGIRQHRPLQACHHQCIEPSCIALQSETKEQAMECALGLCVAQAKGDCVEEKQKAGLLNDTE